MCIRDRYIHLTSLGLGPHFLHKAPIICIKYCFALVVILLKCLVHSNFESINTPRYLVSYEYSTSVLYIFILLGSSSLFDLVNIIATVFCGLNLSPAFSPQITSSLITLWIISTACCGFFLCKSKLQSSANPVPFTPY